MTNQQMHAKLYQLIRSNPSTCMKPKKHGCWLRLDLWYDEFFCVDTYNRLIQLKRGSGIYDYWNGFEGDVLRSCGMDFGGFSYGGTTEQLQHALALAEHAMAERAAAHAPEVGRVCNGEWTQIRGSAAQRVLISFTI